MKFHITGLLCCFAVQTSLLPLQAEETTPAAEDKGALSRMLEASDDMLNASKDLVGDWLGGNDSDKFPIVWEKAYPTLDELLALKDQHEDLPDSAWFTTDKVSNQEKINNLLHAAVDILGISKVQDRLLEIKQLEENLKQARQDMGEWQTKKVGRPNKADKYDGKIADLKHSIQQYEQQIAEKKTNITQALQASGVSLSEEQLDVLMSSVIGEDVLEMSVVFDNVKRLSQQLATLMQENGENLEFARKHYGMYAILLEVVSTMQADFVGSVMDKYLPAIDKIAEDSKELQRRTQLLLDAESDAIRRADLQSSREAQQLTVDTIKLYRTRLKAQADQTLEAKARVEKDLEVALIRYQTVKLSGELVAMIQASNHQFQALANLQLPSLTPFENLAMKAEYEKLTQTLRQAEIQ